MSKHEITPKSNTGVIVAPVGRPLRIKTAQELTDLANEYYVNCKAENRPFTVIGFITESRISKGTWHKLISGGQGKAMQELAQMIKQLAEVDLVEGAMTGLYQPTISALSLRCNYGYDVDKPQEDEKPVVPEITFIEVKGVKPDVK